MIDASPGERRRGGDKRSSWLAFQRRLWLVRRLVRDPADAAALVAEARAQLNHLSGDDIYPGDARAALRADIRRLRDEYACDIRLQPDRRYALVSLGQLALLDLPDADLEALAFLVATFSEGSLPNADRVDALLARIVNLLPAERRRLLARAPHDVRIDTPTPSADIPAQPRDLLRQALGRRQVQFGYRSTYAQGDAVVLHRVAPYDLFFRDGHHYLDAYCLECAIPELVHSYVLYRVDRIVADSLRRLPDVLPPAAPPRPRHRLRYRLGPQVARQRDIALWFPSSEVVFEADGSALISAQTSDLWQARQILLRYREHCRVLEPPELVALIRESLERMSEGYR